jgi:hypothetical protein
MDTAGHFASAAFVADIVEERRMHPTLERILQLQIEPLDRLVPPGILRDKLLKIDAVVELRKLVQHECISAEELGGFVGYIMFRGPEDPAGPISGVVAACLGLPCPAALRLIDLIRMTVTEEYAVPRRLTTLRYERK